MENVAPSSAQGEHPSAHDLRATDNATLSPGDIADHTEQVTGRGRTLLVFALIVFVGVNLRSVILAVPPVLPLIQRDLRLSYTATGLLTSLPLLLMCAFALPAGLLAGRFGGRRIVAVGLALLAAGAILRGLWPTAFPLYLFTVALGAGITLAQTSVPVLARQWFPARIGLVAALFSDGLILGETLAAAFTLPLMGYFFGGDGWPGALLLWAIPTVLALALWLDLRAARRRDAARAIIHASTTSSARSPPDQRAPPGHPARRGQPCLLWHERLDTAVQPGHRRGGCDPAGTRCPQRHPATGGAAGHCLRAAAGWPPLAVRGGGGALSGGDSWPGHRAD